MRALVDDRGRPGGRGPVAAGCALILALLPASCGDVESGIRAAAADRGPALDARRGEDRPGGAAPGERPPAGPATMPPSWTGALRTLVSGHLDGVRTHSGGSARASDVELSIHVVDLATGYELASIEADAPRAPASNMKLVTTAAALCLLGPGAEYLTLVEAHGPVEGGRLRGDLVLRAAGDPVCRADGDGRVEERLDTIASQLVERGIRTVTGDVVLDEGAFQAPAPAPGWPDASQHWQEHCALAGGFSLNGGVLQARLSTGRAGSPAALAVHPSPHGLRSSYGVEAGTDGRLDVRVGASASTVTVRGTMPAHRELYTAEFAHPDPVLLFGHVLLDRLARGGVRVEGRLVRRAVPAEGTPVAELRSGLDETLVAINAHSRNSVADQLFLALGNSVVGAGTRAGGERAVRMALERLGVSPDGLVQVDGSGLSRDNRVSARQLTALMCEVLRSDPLAAERFSASLSVAGESGTLSERMRGTAAAGRVRGKTGWIRGVSSVSGLCRTLDGRDAVFSILVQYPPAIGGLNTRVFKPMQDALLARMAEGLP